MDDDAKIWDGTTRLITKRQLSQRPIQYDHLRVLGHWKNKPHHLKACKIVTKHFFYKIPAPLTTMDNKFDLTFSNADKINWSKSTDKRTDVWSQDFIKWKIDYGLWAVWSGLDCKIKGSGWLWATFGPVFSLFHGQKKFSFIWKRYRVRT